MSRDVRANRSGMFILGLYVVAPGLLLVGGVVFLLTGGSKAALAPKTVIEKQQENHLAAVRTTLAKQTDHASCLAIVPQLNWHLQKYKDQPAALSPEVRELLHTQIKLPPDDLAEVESPTFTVLDASHLEGCLLMRDAARGLELATPGGRGSTVKQTPLDRAELAFAWVMRQVSLAERSFKGRRTSENDPVPPQFALRRGWVTPLERALVFLSLLEQFGLDDDASARLRGALVFLPLEKGQRRLWACGVAIGEKPQALYLFDPRLGLPVPGPGGKGIATLAQACSDPSVLGQLKNGALSYDVTPAQAREAEVCFFCPLSAMAPRMRLLQDRLLRDRTWNDQPLPAQIRVRLTEDMPAALGALQAAVKPLGGSPVKVRLWPEGVTILRRFMPNEEGGSDSTRARRLLFLSGLVPWDDFPGAFRDPQVFQADKGLGLVLHQVFYTPFLKPLLEPNSPRDRILRGRPIPAAPELVKDQEYWQQMRRRLLDGMATKEGIREWVERAVSTYANELRNPGDPIAKAQVTDLWRWKPDDPINVLMHGTAGEGRAAEIVYQLGLCKHEVAAQLQARKELAERGKVERPEDASKAALAWKDAECYWKEFIDTYPKRNGAIAARLHLAEAQALRGEYQPAIRTLEDLSADMSDLEKLARLWLIKQWTKKVKGK